MTKSRYYVVDPMARKTLGSFTSFSNAKIYQIKNDLLGTTQIWGYRPETLVKRTTGKDRELIIDMD